MSQLNRSNQPGVETITETKALYAIMNGQYDKAQQIVNEMLPDDRSTYRHQLEELVNMISCRFEQEAGI